MIWDTFDVDKVVDVSARVLLCLSPHASLYPSHLPYLFLRQMWYLIWKHKMLKMSTREKCQVRTRPKEKIGKSMIWDTLAFNPDDMRYSCSGVACLQRQALSKEIWLSKFGEQCLFGFRTSNPVGDLALEIQRTMPLQFLRKQSCWESDS
ncbi:hypothetical protein ACFX2G_029253 [Malus domestica]